MWLWYLIMCSYGICVCFYFCCIWQHVKWIKSCLKVQKCIDLLWELLCCFTTIILCLITVIIYNLGRAEYLAEWNSGKWKWCHVSHVNIFYCYNGIYVVSQKKETPYCCLYLLQMVVRFLHFFRWHVLSEICNKATVRSYYIPSMSQHYLDEYKYLQCSQSQQWQIMCSCTEENMAVVESSPCKILAEWCYLQDKLFQYSVVFCKVV